VCNIQRLTGSLNALGALGTITKAILDMQLQGVDAVMAKYLPHLLNHSLRVRQLLSLKKLDLTMQLGATEIHLPASLTNITHTLEAIAPQYLTDTQPIKDIYLLHKIGVTQVEQLLSPNTALSE
jgi:hypothetical protein